MTTDFKTLCYELQCQWVGPMPIESFLQEFLKIDQTKLEEKPKLSQEYFNSIPHAVTPSEIPLSFIKLVRESGIMPNLELFPCLDDDPEIERESNPEIVAYDPGFVSNPDQTISYEHCQLIFDIRPQNTDIDIFEDLSTESTIEDLEIFISRLKDGRFDACRAQLTHHARAWMSRQHRTHCFMVWVRDPWARIIRFDRSGAIVTERFDIRSKSHLLLDFLWRISCASPEMRGKDTTVTPVTDEATIKLAQEKLNQWVTDSQRTQAVLKLKIPDGGSIDDPQWREVLVCGLLADRHCVVGRATRGYPAWDLEKKKLVFVKDSWRVVAEDMSKETDILTTLNTAQVCNVPTLLLGDDLPQQVTRTQEFASAEWNRGAHPESFSKRAHIRFATDLIGTHLTKFKCSKQFVQAWLDALLAHQEAYEKCGILHRDISLNNILLRPEGGGFLNDWDLARSLSDNERGPRQTHRAGTWQFMSIHLLSEPDKKHTLQDDLEAFFWVLLYVTIRYLITNLIESRKPIPWVMSTIFDAVRSDGTRSTGGWHKKEVLNERQYIGRNFEVTNNIPLSALILEVLGIIKFYYQFWINLSDEVRRLARRDKITLEAAEALYHANSSEELVDFTSHDSMVQLSREALAGVWPPNDSPVDHCATDDEKSTKRRAVDDVFNSPGSGSERMKKRVKQ